jgi:transposase InsO family protein
LRECAYSTAYATSVERRRALRPFLAYYNRRRPHASLRYEPALVQASERCVMNNVFDFNS